MCKLALFPVIKKGKEDLVFELARELTPLMTQYDQDGFGYAALGEQGVFTERWLNPENAWDSGNGTVPEGLIAQALDLSHVLGYASSGMSTDRVYSLMLHARMATAPKGMINTHPFTSDCGSATLVHNGVIGNADFLGLKNTTCDSEAILLRYVDENVTLDASKIDAVTSELDGYYACGVLSTDGERWFADIFKDSRASLFAAYIDDIEAWVFVTKEEHIREACDTLGMRISMLYEVKANTMLRFDAISGELVEVRETTPYTKHDRWETERFTVDESEGLRTWSKLRRA